MSGAEQIVAEAWESFYTTSVQELERIESTRTRIAQQAKELWTAFDLGLAPRPSAEVLLALDAAVRDSLEYARAALEASRQVWVAAVKRLEEEDP